MAKKLSPMEQKSAKKVLGDLRGTAQDMMKGKMKSLKKVTVASDTKEGLKKGLSVAEKIMGGDKKDPSAVDEEMCPACGECPCECDEEGTDDHEDDNQHPERPTQEAYSETDGDTNPLEDMSDEEIDARIKELLAKKKKAASK